MPSVRITEENVVDYPVGTVVYFNYGAMHGQEEAVIIGFENTKWGTHLIARKTDGSTETISTINTADMSQQIGTYYREIAKTEKNPKSPWYRES